MVEVTQLLVEACNGAVYVSAWLNEDVVKTSFTCLEVVTMSGE